MAENDGFGKGVHATGLIETPFSRFAYASALFSVCCFGLVKTMAAVSQELAFYATGLGASAAAVLLIILRRLNGKIHEALSVPLALYLSYTAYSLVIADFQFFFLVCLAFSCLGAFYFSPRHLLWYVIVSNAVSLILAIPGFPAPVTIPGVDGNAAVRTLLAEWLISAFGEICILIIVSYAYTKNKSDRESQNSFNSLLVATPNRIVLMDPYNRVTGFSAPFMRMIKLIDPEMAIGRPLLDLIGDTNLKQMVYEILEHEGFYQEERGIILDGEQRYFEIITNTLGNNDNGRLILMIDVTQAMKARFEAESASQSKSAFLATMSHEIRTPLNAIIGLSEIGLQRKLTMEARQDLEKIRNSGASLLAIVNDILDISKIEAGSLELVQVSYDLPSLVNDTVQLNIVRIGSKQIVFHLEIDESMPSKLFGDELRVKQVLNNILSNAFKYTEAGAVTMKVEWERRNEDAWLTFTVRDTGRGIKKEDIPKLFSEYRQLDAKANRHIEGTGLGLAITRNLVELMNGRIAVESEYDKGSVFTIMIPQHIIDASPIGETTTRNLELFRFRADRSGRNLRLMRNYMPYGRVLVVDDVETNLDVAKGLMLPYGLSIDTAVSGREAIEKIRAVAETPTVHRYDVILMDHMMPGMDGMEATRIIRNEIDNEYAKTVPILALTATALAGNEELFLSNGFNAYITKPIDVTQLDMALNSWIRNKQSKEILRQAEMEQAARDEESVPDLPNVLDDLFVEGLDLIQGRERYNSETAYLEVLRSYHVHTPVLLDKMRGFAGKDAGLPEYTVTVHGLKGSSSGICANTVSQKAQELEIAARAGDYEKINAENAAFIQTVELLLEDIGALLKKVAAGREKKPKSQAPDMTQLTRLLEAAKRFKTSSMEEILTEIESFEYENGGELVTWLREQMDNLEYGAIRERLESPDPFTRN
ncbi:MAG: response regulator [Treponema sp.]|jgi:signal transduction histidine kinase/DNA-binding NarL/FixJ family response regulator|nr:response regulator [Treponema sp.]